MDSNKKRKRRSMYGTDPQEAIGVRLPLDIVTRLRRQSEQELRPVSVLVRTLILKAWAQQERQPVAAGSR